MENAALQTRAVECQQIALGISLRDYFAGQALAGMSALYEVHHNAGETEVANWAYQQAEAMLAVRNACPECGGKGAVDSGGYTPWGAPIDIPCGACRNGVIAEQPQLPTRGQLAMAAMQGMLAANCRGTAHVMARDAVAYADALLAELKKEQQCPRLAALKEAHRVLMESHKATGELHWISPGETLLEYLGNVIEDAGGSA